MTNKQQQIDKAIRNLIKYSQKDEWKEMLNEVTSDLFDEASEYLEGKVSSDELLIIMQDNDLFSVIFGYIFEYFATFQLEAYETEEVSYTKVESMIDIYCKQRGWRETSHGLNYLKALNTEEIQLWEIVDVDAGSSIHVRILGTLDTPIKVTEHSASQSLKLWDCIAARVMFFDGKYILSGGVLNFSTEQGAMIQRHLANIYKTWLKTSKAAQEKGQTKVKLSKKEIEAQVKNAIDEYAPEYYFAAWVVFAYTILTNTDRPHLVNSSGDDLQLCKVTFPIKKGMKSALIEILHSAIYLQFDEEINCWTWLEPLKKRGQTILATLSINKNTLIIDANSIERAKKIQIMIADLLGENVGTPLTVHEPIPLSNPTKSTHPTNKPEMSLSPLEATKIISDYMTQHYKDTLNEPIPALNNQTPLACSKKKTLRPLLETWLKMLENSSEALPDGSHYDFTWMRQALGMETE